MVTEALSGAETLGAMTNKIYLFIAEAMGAKPAKAIFIGLDAQEEHQHLSKNTTRKAQAAGRQLTEEQ